MNTSEVRKTDPADWVRMREGPYTRGDKVRERVAFGILIILLIFLFAFTFAVLGKGEYVPGGETPPSISSNLA
jgi:hypothetical protein